MVEQNWNDIEAVRVDRGPKLAPSSDTDWRRYYEDKCREQRKQIDLLKHFLEQAHPHVCSMCCPSEGKAGVPIGHSEICQQIIVELEIP